MGKYQGWPRPGILSVWLLTVQISTPALLRAGINPIEVLLWSRNKTLVEVEEALQAVRNQRQFDFTKDKGFVLKNKDQNTSEESVPKEVHVHFEDDIKLTCPRRNCTFSFNLPKATGDWRNINFFKFPCWNPLISGGDSLTTSELIQSHMALKHREKQYQVSPEILQTWGVNYQRSRSELRPVRKAVKTSKEIR